MKITKKQKDLLWGWDWPYSEAHLTFETRILNDEISRFFIIVEVNINPTTFEICKQNIKHFKDDEMAYQLLNNAMYISDKDWYKSCAFINEYDKDDEDYKKILSLAKKSLKYSEETLIKLHKYVMDFLWIESYK